MDVKKFYNERFSECGRDIASVGWRDRSTQYLRFDVLTRGLELNGKAILDFGCGLGDFVHYLEERKIQGYRYTGLDISDLMIEDNRLAFKGEPHEFLSGNFLEMDLGSRNFDVIIASGTFSFKSGDNMESTRVHLEKLFSVAKQSLNVNFLTKYADFELEKNFHYWPEDVFRMARKLTKKVNLYHDYPLYEFTIQLLK